MSHTDNRFDLRRDHGFRNPPVTPPLPFPEAWRSARDTPNNRAAAFSFRESAWQTQPHRYRYQPHQHHSAHAPARDDGSSWRSSGNNTVEASLPPSTDRARYPDKNAVVNNHRQQIDGTAVVSSKGWTDQSVVVTNAVGGWTGSAAHTTNGGLQNERPGDAIPCGDFPAASPPGADAVVRGSDGWRGGGGVLKAAGGAGGMASILETHAEVAGEEEEDEENGEELEFVLTPEWAEHFRSSPSLQRYLQRMQAKQGSATWKDTRGGRGKGGRPNSAKSGNKNASGGSRGPRGKEKSPQQTAGSKTEKKKGAAGNASDDKPKAQSVVTANKDIELELAKIKAQALLYAGKWQDSQLEDATPPS